jgi:hypothetical protein
VWVTISVVLLTAVLTGLKMSAIVATLANQAVTV